MDEYYNKRKGGAGHHGGEYQMKVIMFFLLKAFEGERDFKFSSENLDDFSLDDAVLLDDDKNICASVKHAEDENEKINLEALFSKTHNHSVLTPLESYKKKYLEHLEDLNKSIQKTHIKDSCISTLKEYARTALEGFKVNSSNYEEIFKQLSGNICELKNETLLTKIKWFENSCPHLIINIEPHPKIKKEFALEKHFSESDFFFTDVQSVYYSFKPAETLAKIKSTSINGQQENFSDFFVTHFFRKFKLVILKDELLKRNIESKLRSLDIFKKSRVDFETTYYHIFNKIKDWYGSYKDGNKGYFLTRFHLEVMFSDLWSNAYVKQLKTFTNKFQFEIESLVKKINEKTVTLVKSPRYLLLMVKLQEKWYKEVEKEQILFVNPNDNIELQKCSTKSFLYHKYTHLVCPLLIDKNEELVSDLNNILPNLRQYKKILLITELNLNIRHPNIDFISDQELYNNFILKDVRRLKSMGDMDKYYVPRYFKWQYDTFSEEKFLKTIVESNEKIILIIDGPGMGKTTLLTNLTCKINQRDDLCALNIQLNRFTNVLKEGLKQNNLQLEDFLPHTSTIEDLVDSHIYTIPKIIYLMIDAVDEVSPKYTHIILNFLQNVSKRVAKIIVSSREHLKRELSESLNVNPYSLIPFTSQEQKKFIISYWICNLGLKNQDKIENCTKYCDLLLKRLAHALSNQFWDCLGIPLQTRMIAEIFLKGVSAEFTGCLQYLEGVNHNVTLPGDISLGRLYDLFVDRRREIYLEEKCNIQGNVAAEQSIIKEFNSYTTLCEEISVRLLFSRKYWNLFNLKEDDLSKYDENLYKIGLLILPAENWWSYSHHSSSEESDTGHNVQRPQFLHRSFGEYFAAKIICRKLFDKTNAELKFTKFFLNIFLKDKHVYIQRFIESTLANNYDRISGEIERQFQEVLQNTVFTPDINLNMLPYRGCLHILKKFLGSTDRHKEWINILYGAEKESLLHNSVKHLEILTQLVEHGADVNLKSMFDRTVLHCAAENGYIDAVKYLIERVDDIDAETQAGLTPLHEAIFSNHTEIAKLLVEKGASLRKRTGGGWTCLHYAALMGNFDLIKFFLSKGVDVNEQTTTNSPGSTAFHIAFGRKYFEICEYLLSTEGINVNLKDNKGWGLWSFAVTMDNDAFDFLNKIRELYNIEIETDCEALCLAVRKTDCKRLQFLLDLGFDINSKNREGWTPLTLSVKKRKKDTFSLLIDKDADKKVATEDGCTILHVAAGTRDLDMFIMVEKHFDNYNSKTVDGQNILHRAAMSGDLQLVEYIYKKSKTLAFENALDGSTCLHYAAQSHCEETVQYFVEKVGLRLNAQAKNGKTPLHVAVEQGHEDIVKFLVDKLKKEKIDLNFKINESFVLFVPNIKFHNEITELLLKSGVKESIIKKKVE